MKVKLTAAALADLDKIVDFIARDNPARAVTFGEELLDVAQAIGDLPLGCQVVPRYEHVGIRRKVYRAYTLFYWIIDGRVDVLHILNAAQDYEAILSKGAGGPE